MIVPPSWIVKVPRKGSFKSSLKTSPNKKKKKGIGKTEKIDEAECEDDAGVVQVRVKRDDACFMPQESIQALTDLLPEAGFFL